jgi:prophage antirepressor-like protein
MQNTVEKTALPSDLVKFTYKGKPFRILPIGRQECWFVPADVQDMFDLSAETLKGYVGNAYGSLVCNFRFESGELKQTVMLDEKQFRTILSYKMSPATRNFKIWYRANVLKYLQSLPNEEEKSIDFQIFTFEEGDNIRVFLDEKNEPWFVAKDICKFLELDNVSKACERLKDFEKTTITISDSGSNYKHSALIVSESGFYNLVFGSRKPEAENFRVWVTCEVLPTIRKTGKYEIMPTPETTVIEGFTPKQVEMLRQIIQERVQTLETSVAYILSVLPTLLPQKYEGKPSYCYLGQNKDNLSCKIGKADNPSKRIDELELGGSKISLLKTIKLPNEETAFFIENFFHTLFNDFVEGREWFKLTKADIDVFVKIADALNTYYEGLIEQTKDSGSSEKKGH